MYQDNKENIDWVKIVLRVIIAFLVLILSIKLISIIVQNRDIKIKTTSMEDNLKVMDTIARKYFVDDKLPEEIGKSNKVTLDYLIEEGLSEDIVDSDGIKCNYEESFIKVTKLDSEYQIQSSLTCGSEQDYLNSFIEIEEEDIITIKPSTTKKVTTTKKTTKKTTTKTTTTKKVTTTTTKVDVKRHEISFNPNGGSYISHQLIKEGNKATSYIPYREGYEFVGWYYQDKEFDFNTKIYQDYVLVAKWIKK